MKKIPVKLKRVAAAFDEVARARLCESSGSEHSALSFTDLSDLVNSFLEKEINDIEGSEEVDDKTNDGDEIEGVSQCSEYETKDVLKSLLGIGDNDVKRKIHVEVEKACLHVGNFSSPGSKRLLMARLRDRGLDAGLCKSKWEKNGRCLSGVYEYIDVMINGTRYIVDVSLAGEFEIARPTGFYASLLEVFPPIFVGKEEELKKIVKIMCSAIRTSIKSADIHVPPWRRLAYMQAKWFSSYKRTLNEVLAEKALNANEASSAKRSIGLVLVPIAVSYYCRDDFASKASRKLGKFGCRSEWRSLVASIVHLLFIFKCGINFVWCCLVGVGNVKVVEVHIKNGDSIRFSSDAVSIYHSVILAHYGQLLPLAS